MSEFIINNMETLLAALAAILLLFYALYTKQWGILRSSGLSLMLAAERLLTTVEGKKKMEWVYATMWQKLPKWVKKYVTEKTLKEKLQEWYDLAKDELNKIENN